MDLLEIHVCSSSNCTLDRTSYRVCSPVALYVNAESLLFTVCWVDGHSKGIWQIFTQAGNQISNLDVLISKDWISLWRSSKALLLPVRYYVIFGTSFWKDNALDAKN